MAETLLEALKIYQQLIAAGVAFVAATWGNDFLKARRERRELNRRRTYVRRVLLLEVKRLLFWLGGERDQWARLTPQQAEALSKGATTEMTPRVLFNEVRKDLVLLDIEAVEAVLEFHFRVDDMDMRFRHLKQLLGFGRDDIVRFLNETIAEGERAQAALERAGSDLIN
jgi:hypothetical protein